jgi:sulfatase modifying factor 1
MRALQRLFPILPALLMQLRCQVVSGFEEFSGAGVTGSGGAGGGSGGTGGVTGAGGSPARCPSPPSGDASMIGLPRPGGACAWIDAKEVTMGDFGQFLTTAPAPHLPHACDGVADLGADGACLASVPSAGGDLRPQVCVSWCQALAFCTGKGKRLCPGSFARFNDPAASVWQAACANGDAQTLYPYGNALEPGACNLGGPALQAVGTRPDCHSGSGVLDLLGNAEEWTDECQQDVGLDDVCKVRGGSFADDQGSTACDVSAALARGKSSPRTGFRCCDQ